MPYAEESFRPRPRTKASRKATADERQGLICEALRGMTCPLTVGQVVEKIESEMDLKFNERDTLAALRKLKTAGRMIDASDGAVPTGLWRLPRRHELMAAQAGKP